MRIRDRPYRITREAEREMVTIRQGDGTVKRFYQYELEPAVLIVIARITRGSDEEMLIGHLPITAGKLPPDHIWVKSFYSAEPTGTGSGAGSS